MKTNPLRCFVLFTFIALCLLPSGEAAAKGNAPLSPVHYSTKRGSYTIEIVGDTLHQAAPDKARLIIRIGGAENKLVKPDEIRLVEKNGKAIDPSFRDDHKVGHEENSGLPFTVGGYGDSSGAHVTGVGVNLNKIFGPHGDYAYTKVDWPKQIFTADKRLQIVMPGGQSIVLPLTALAK